MTNPVLYQVPLILEKLNVGDYLLNRLGLEARVKPNWDTWERLVEEVTREKPVLRIALVGKYVELQDAYMSVREAVKQALALGVEIDIVWVHSAELEKGRGWDLVKSVDGIIVPGGFGSRGIEGKIRAARYAREKQRAISGAVPGDAADGRGVCPPRTW